MSQGLLFAWRPLASIYLTAPQPPPSGTFRPETEAAPVGSRLEASFSQKKLRALEHSAAGITLRQLKKKALHQRGFIYILRSENLICVWVTIC